MTAIARLSKLGTLELHNDSHIPGHFFNNKHFTSLKSGLEDDNISDETLPVIAENCLEF